MTTIGPVDLIVTHLTRMHGGHVCIAGIDQETGKHIRPITMDRMTRGYLERPGGTIHIGSIVRFRSMTPTPKAPEVEDHRFLESGSDVVGQVSPDDLWEILSAAADPNLASIFGPSLVRNGHTWAMSPGTGVASLGVLRARGVQGPFVDSYEKVRLTIVGDDDEVVRIPVTDLRVYLADDGKPDRQAVIAFKQRLERKDVLLSVGVGRPWPRDGEPPMHWLQVNNIHLQPSGVP